jgi:lipopolysaccharide transport system ATP-binding protein
MSDITIQIQDLSKQYHIGKAHDTYPTLREQMADFFVAPVRRARKLLRGQATGAAELDETIWALRDISFEVNQGEIVGIIGRNGAGKSTLLKILSRITEPTSGWARIRGRVGSLLEVGTGFHQELTGRENVFLNGAILGMTQAEIQAKFDEIVSFSEVGKFIDTPVKHYSSGMRLRLAFAVAAHLEPEILIIDEVLSVGDARFQRKCLNKMQDVRQVGRTVLFVSHNMSAITRLCERTILLDEGRIIADGPSHKVVSTYLNSGLGTTAAREWPDPATAPASEVARLRAARVKTEDGQISDSIKIWESIGIEIEYDVLQSGHILMPHFFVNNSEGTLVFVALDQDPTWQGRPRPAGRYLSTGWIPGNLLTEDSVMVGVALRSLEPNLPQFYEPDVVAFQIVDTFETDKRTARGRYAKRIPGVIRPLLKWETQYISNGHETASHPAHEIVSP